MGATVWFVRASVQEPVEAIAAKIRRLFEAAEFGKLAEPGELVAIKMHFGEKHNDTHVQPEMVWPIVQSLIARGAKPFVTDTNVLYRSERSNAVDHLLLAHRHGFTPERVGAPVLILDGLRGNQEFEIEIPGQIYRKVSLAAGLALVDVLITISHVTGHIAMGLGGTLKNMGMGLSSRMGKLRQHSASKPYVDQKACTGCWVCIRWCPEDAIVREGQVAWIDPDRCIGCGECLTVCRFDAVRHDWRVESAELQRRVAEHALGAAISKKGKLGCFNFVLNVTKDCDCLGRKQVPVVPDVGILASTDPVAIDAAALDLIREVAGAELFRFAYPHLDGREQLRHAEKIGLGTQKYELVEITA